MLADVPAARRKCDRTLPGAPCPSYDDGTWPEGCDCYMRLNDDRGDNSLALTLFTLLLAAIALVVMVWVVMASATAADNDKPSCLTKDQARVQYPKQHLYWHTKDHCWDNIRVYPKVDRTNKGDRLPLVDANGNKVRSRPTPADLIDNMQYREEAERRLRTCCWPPMPTPTFLPWDERIGK